MATVKAKNPVTGATFDVNEAEFSSTYKPLGWSLVEGSQVNQPTAPTQSSPAAPGASITLPTGQTISASDPNYAEYAKQYQPAQETAPAPAQPVDPAIASKPGVAALVSSNKVFTEEDAKKYAYSKGEPNWQQYVGASSGQTNPLYIGATNWAKLQKIYTPYQLQQATVKNATGIYWNQNVNIAGIPRLDPNDQINSDAKKLADIVSGAKSEADKFTSDAAKLAADREMSSSPEMNQDTLFSMLQSQYGGNAEKIYNELFNTPEMKTAQEEVNTLKAKLDEYDQQLEELKDDIRAEVEGEATDSYISALAAVRGDKILRAKRSVQRDYDTALANYNGLKENANNLLNVRVKDADTRYNQLFSMLQLQIQQQGTAFNQELALNQLALQIPEGRSMTIGGSTVTGLKENDNLNVVQFTDASGKTYVIGMDKKTGQEAYKTYIGTAKVAGSGTPTPVIDLETAKSWLQLAIKKDGTYDLSAIPSEVRTGVVNAISAGIQSGAIAPAEEKSMKDKLVDWWNKNIW